MRSKIIKTLFSLIFVAGSLLAREVKSLRGIYYLPVRPLSKHVQQIVDDCCKQMNMASHPVVMESPELLDRKNCQGVNLNERIDLDSTVVKALEPQSLFSFFLPKKRENDFNKRVCALNAVYHELAHFKYHALRKRMLMEGPAIISVESMLCMKAMRLYCAMFSGSDREIRRTSNELEQFLIENDSLKNDTLCNQVIITGECLKEDILDGKGTSTYTRAERLKNYGLSFAALHEKIQKKDKQHREFEADAIACDALGCYKCVEIVRDRCSFLDLSKGYFDMQAYDDVISILQEEDKLCDHHRAMEQ